MGSFVRTTDFASLIGTWPFSMNSAGSADRPYLLSGVLRPQARIISVKREPSSGYDLNGLSFLLHIDSHVSSPFTVAFVADGMTLNQVVSKINADCAAYGTVAYNDNGFLKLESSAGSAEESYLRLESIATAEAVFDILGLYSGTESRGGELVPAAHADPTRQVAVPGQALMMRGETFSADVFNRLAVQLAVNSERSVGLLDRKQIAIRKEAVISYGGVNPYFQLSDKVYTGPATPQIEDLIAILDEDGNEILVEQEHLLVGPAPVTYVTDPNSKEMTVTGSLGFSSSDDTMDMYVQINGMTPAVPALEGVNLKIERYISATQVVVLNVDPVTGARVTANGSSAGGNYKLEIVAFKVAAEGFFKEAGLTTDVNQLKESRYSGVVSRIELNNRVVCSSADFSDVAIGDLVVWSGSTIADPFTNDGTYRVSRVIDNITLELMGENGAPICLNPVEVTPSGTIDVTTDGDFWQSPYVKFALDPFTGDPVLPPAGNLQIQYLSMSTLRDALEADVAAIAGSVKFQQEADFVMEKAIVGLTGPSVSTLEEALSYLYSDRRRSVEELFFRIESEHHTDETVAPGGTKGGPGRHSTIRPDVIDMFPEVTGTTVTVRAGSAAEDKGGASLVNKLVLRAHTYLGGAVIYSVRSDGKVTIDNGPSANPSADPITGSVGYSHQVGSGSGAVAAGVVGTAWDAIFDVVQNFPDDTKAAILRVSNYRGTNEVRLRQLAAIGFRADVATTAFMGTNRLQFLSELGSDYRNFALCHQPTNDLLKLDGKKGSTEYNAVMSWKLFTTGIAVGIGTADPNHVFVIKSVNPVVTDLFSLEGASTAQDTVTMNLLPRGRTGNLGGSLTAYDNGAGVAYIALNSEYVLYLAADDGISINVGGAARWLIDASGYLTPNATTQRIGSITKYVSQLHVKDIYGDTGDYISYDRTNNGWNFFFGSSQLADIGLNPLNSDYIEMCLGGNLGDLPNRMLTFSRYYNSSGPTYQTEIRFNDGNVAPLVLLRWSSANSDALAFRDGSSDLMLFEGTTFIPAADALSGYTLGTSAKRWFELFAARGRFDGILRVPAVTCTERNAQNAVVARGHVSSAGALLDSDTSHWNIASITKLGGSGAYRINFDNAVSVDCSFHITVKASSSKHCTIDTVAADGTYFTVGIWDAAGNLEDNEFYVTVIGKHY